MAHAAPTKSKINTNPTQPARGRAAQRAVGGGKKSRGGRGPARVNGDARESVRSTDRPVIELDFGILVYPPETEGEFFSRQMQVRADDLPRADIPD